MCYQPWRSPAGSRSRRQQGAVGPGSIAPCCCVPAPSPVHEVGVQLSSSFIRDLGIYSQFARVVEVATACFLGPGFKSG